MRKLLQKILGAARILHSRVFAVAVLALGLSCVTVMVTTALNIFYIYDGGEAIVKVTTSDDLDHVLEDNGIYTASADEVHYDGISGNLGEVHISRAFPVYVYVDGQYQMLMMTQGTVATALERLGIFLGPDDLINMSTNHFVEENDVIVINRVEYVTTYEEEVVPYETTQRITPLYRPGRSTLLSAGKEGKKRLTYVERTVDGVVEERELVADDLIKTPVPAYTLVGGNAPISPLDFGYTISNNAPTSYKWVLEGAKCTGYTAKSGAGTASGRRADVGHVAVNPNVIPYGSKLYITSADGSFVYGYAIAADTGTGLMNGVVDIDLFYETYLESCLNGVRYLNVYVLE